MKTVITGKGLLSPQGRAFNAREAFSDPKMLRLPRFSQMAVFAARLALENAKLDTRGECDVTRGGIFISSVHGPWHTEGKFLSSSNPVLFPEAGFNAAAGDISIFFGIKGPSLSLGGAGGGLEAVETARRWILRGRIDWALVGGLEERNPFLDAWYQKQNASSSRGRVALTEGAGFVVLESDAHARKRKAQIQAMVSGVGSAFSDNHTAENNARKSSIEKALGRMFAASGKKSKAEGVLSAASGCFVCDAAETEAVAGAGLGEIVGQFKKTQGEALGASGIFNLIAGIDVLESETMSSLSVHGGSCAGGFFACRLERGHD